MFTSLPAIYDLRSTGGCSFDLESLRGERVQPFWYGKLKMSVGGTKLFIQKLISFQNHNTKLILYYQIEISI